KVDNLDKLERKQINKTSLKNYINNEPISGVKTDECLGIFAYSRHNSIAWELFIKLTKELVREIPEITERKTKYRNSKYGYFEHNGIYEKQKLISNFTDEEFRISVDMLNEMTVIYNKYYKELHPTVNVKFAHQENDDFIPVKIEDIG
ncbi:hypothetical protein, partial [Anaerorhabdus sp.]|uniref:hypothetical protein n=1 Tax=Anaerorhabdus sp. TaxID=1872524 RepID=UPI002FC711AF